MKVQNIYSVLSHKHSYAFSSDHSRRNSRDRYKSPFYELQNIYTQWRNDMNEDDYIDVGDNDDNVTVSGPQHTRMVSVAIAYW